MESIKLSKCELNNLDIINSSGIEANISRYRETKNKQFIRNYNLLKGKIIKSYKENGMVKKVLTESEYNGYLDNKHQKVLAYSRMYPNNFKIFNIPLGPIYLNKQFLAFYQNDIKHSITLNKKCYDTHSNDYTNLNFITDVVNQMQQGVKEELHPNGIYTDDLQIGNILVDKNNNIHFIDADSYRVNNHLETSYYYRRFYFEDTCYKSLRENAKYLEDGFICSSPQLDIFCIYANFIELVSKRDIFSLSEQSIFSLLEFANFPNEFLDCFSKCLSADKDNQFIPIDVLDKIKTDYTIDVKENLLIYYGKLKRK